MIAMLKSVIEDLKKLKLSIKEIDKETTVIFIAVALLQTISWYYTSRTFFRTWFYYQYFEEYEYVKLVEYLYWFAGDFLVYFVVPLLLIYYFHKKRGGDFGLCLGDYRTGLKYTFLFLLFMLPIIIIVSASPAFQENYPHLQQAKTDWLVFFIFEAGMLFYMAAWEFIWRGYFLFGLKKQFGNYAVLIQMIPFVILHNGKPDIETFSSILGGIALGILALRTGSFIYGVFVHYGIMFSLDLISVIRNRLSSEDTYGRLSKIFDSLL